MALLVQDGKLSLDDPLRKYVPEVPDFGTPILIRAWTEGDRYHIQIVDRGRGMTPDQWESLGAFMQFDRRTYEQQGIGLGLVIAKRLTELHNGAIHFASKVGQGTVVSVSLPLKPELTATPAPA